MVKSDFVERALGGIRTTALALEVFIVAPDESTVAEALVAVDVGDGSGGTGLEPPPHPLRTSKKATLNRVTQSRMDFTGPLP